MDTYPHYKNNRSKSLHADELLVLNYGPAELVPKRVMTIKDDILPIYTSAKPVVESINLKVK
jgi:hypothetical protein